MASRGSVIPMFVDQVFKGNPLSITDKHMTRFMMTLDDAVDLVIYAFNNAKPGEIFVQKAPAATIDILSKAILSLLKKEEHQIDIIGTRHGEKKFEVLLSREEMACAKDVGNYFIIPPDLRDLNYEKYIDQGEIAISVSDEYNSDNTKRLNQQEMIELLLKLDFINSAIKGDYVNPEI